MFFFFLRLKLSAANHSNNIVSALSAFYKSGFGMIILMGVVIAAEHTMQTISQSDRLDFLPPDMVLCLTWLLLTGEGCTEECV